MQKVGVREERISCETEGLRKKGQIENLTEKEDKTVQSFDTSVLLLSLTFIVRVLKISLHCLGWWALLKIDVYMSGNTVQRNNSAIIS